ncbi:hypothetical protein EDC56_0515 [Sinobacterium caligoides]|uniref:Uncharacterized protein n=1 Tax=Sinobacterium caligoides TaxID=933926 RepID=A0A3N2DYQ6_9GAMM|nr:hypothetical protein EDC56_0515 [Sinobacterium caligoides]
MAYTDQLIIVRYRDAGKLGHGSHYIGRVCKILPAEVHHRHRLIGDEQILIDV